LGCFDLRSTNCQGLLQEPSLLGALIDIEYDGKVRCENRATSLRAEREGQGIDPSMNYSLKTWRRPVQQSLKWRAMTAADLAAIQQLADTQHVYLPERPEYLPRNSNSSATDVWSCAGGDHYRLLLFSPWLLRDAPPLDTPVASSSAVPRNVCSSTTW
jgi:hypothetical protein